MDCCAVLFSFHSSKVSVAELPVKESNYQIHYHELACFNLCKFYRPCSLPHAGANSVVTSNFTKSYPFYEWPDNGTLSLENTAVQLRCMVRSCENGPRIVVGVLLPECEFEASQCLLRVNHARENGIMIIVKEITLSWIVNSSCLPSSSVPVWCEVGGIMSNIGYVYVNYDRQSMTTASDSTTLQTVILPSPSSGAQDTNSSKLTNINVYLVVMACIILLPLL